MPPAFPTKPTPPPPNKRGRTPAQILFDRIQASQGHAFVSDAIGDMPTEQVIAWVKGTALPHSKMAVKIMKKWLKEQGVPL